jgi:hypothetical protein
MAALDQLRALIQDAETPYRVSDPTLTAIMADAMMEVNVWGKTTYSVADLDVADLVPLSHHQVFYLVCKIRLVDADIANVDRGLKFITQDVQLDSSSATDKLTWMKKLLEAELDKKLTYWFGIKHGSIMRHTGQEWGGR